ncbi:hypothetical protein HYC85_005692 [Camellia sinensis]|uniref:Uncharacterized protein n=1 Tax=Camellia sinensis TaxID=4442 RepID=A0A7J7I1E1_CAMSI|nr:hypothetical protein HYC85_005692 [Camellia sinensis]
MRPTAATTAATTTFSSSSSSTISTARHMWKWSSPIPYLFGGLALMLGLITVALIILAYSYKKQPSNSSSVDAEDQIPKTTEAANFEPKFLVVMAGDYKPTYLATPISSSSSS